MKRILYLSFYFDPDLCAGSFRNTPLAKELSAISTNQDVEIDVFTTLPNRYSTYRKKALLNQKDGNINITRIKLPNHKSGFFDQIISFSYYFFSTYKYSRKRKYDLVFASTSRLFTGFLGYFIANRNQTPLYLDVRDIFYDTMKDILKSNLISVMTLPIIKLIEKKTFNYASHINLISEGFKEYFKKYKKGNYSYFSNGIDKDFITYNKKFKNKFLNKNKIILYAGNIGQGQALEKLIPYVANRLKGEYQFKIIGDGGKKKDLEKKIISLKLHNVEIIDPLERNKLMKMYYKADILFLHLNTLDAFLKVLPSKIFELATFPKPILAGVSGFAKQFIDKEINNSYTFEPCNSDDFINKLNNINHSVTINRNKFIKKYNRSNINNLMAKSILSYL